MRSRYIIDTAVSIQFKEYYYYSFHMKTQKFFTSSFNKQCTFHIIIIREFSFNHRHHHRHCYNYQDQHYHQQ